MSAPIHFIALASRRPPPCGQGGGLRVQGGVFGAPSGNGGTLIVNGGAPILISPAPIHDGGAPILDFPAPIYDGGAPILDFPAESSPRRAC